MVIKEEHRGYLRHTDDTTYRRPVHVRVAEEKLGRRLGKSEIPHHIDRVKTNNSPENILILRTSSDHARIHSDIPVEVIQTVDGSHIVIKKQRQCPYCERLFEPSTNDDVFCSLTCYLSNKAKRIPTAAELKKMVWSKPTEHLAKEIGVSDRAIGKWCEKLGVEKPNRGYWTKVKYGKV